VSTFTPGIRRGEPPEPHRYPPEATNDPLNTDYFLSPVAEICFLRILADPAADKEDLIFNTR
jgi:hypothetical protein